MLIFQLIFTYYCTRYLVFILHFFLCFGITILIGHLCFAQTSVHNPQLNKTDIVLLKLDTFMIVMSRRGISKTMRGVDGFHQDKARSR
ncbi:hypothetical protein VNO80_03920 [Phaseolus coccineus]|uniref:Uncharacterized protein n=1 Tax=Phaseolus coccineus TaxID=3886 RepID=A0AAN9NWZ1_PHACN